MQCENSFCKGLGVLKQLEKKQWKLYLTEITSLEDGPQVKITMDLEWEIVT